MDRYRDGSNSFAAGSKVVIDSDSELSNEGEGKGKK